MKNAISTLTICLVWILLIRCNKESFVSELSETTKNTISASQLIRTRELNAISTVTSPHPLFITPQKPASLVDNKYARISGLTLRLKRKDQVYISLMSPNTNAVNDMAFQYLKPNGVWTTIQPFRIKMTNKIHDTLHTHYLLAGDSIPLGVNRDFRLFFIKPSALNSYSLPFTIINLEYIDQVVSWPTNGSGDHGNLNCEELSNDINGHRTRAEELQAIKQLCNNAGLPTIIGSFGTPSEARLPSDEGEARELCSDIDFMISVNDSDLADALEKYRKLGCLNNTLHEDTTIK